MKLLSLLAAFAVLSVQAQSARLSPAFEGVYETTFRCPKGSCASVKKLGRMSVMDAGSRGIQIVFHNTDVGVTSYRLVASRVDRDGEHIEADAFQSMGQAIEWVGDLDRATGRVTAKLRLSVFDEDIEMEARRLFSTASFYKPQATSDLLGLLDLQGNYVAVEGTDDRPFMIRSTLSGTPAVVASWDLGHGARTDFTESEFIAEQGVLLLYAHSGAGTTKWTVAMRRNSTGLVEGKVRAITNGHAGYGYDVILKRSQRGNR